jgi:hypothetical protein
MSKVTINCKFVIFCNWQLIQNFFTAHLPSFVKIKGAFGAVCAFLRSWQLGAQLAITVWNGAVTVKGSYRMGDGRIFIKTSTPLSSINTYGMSLISVGSISLDGTFKCTFCWKILWFNIKFIDKLFTSAQCCESTVICPNLDATLGIKQLTVSSNYWWIFF